MYEILKQKTYRMQFNCIIRKITSENLKRKNEREKKLEKQEEEQQFLIQRNFHDSIFKTHKKITATRKTIISRFEMENNDKI